jgi:hypothetical protein
VRLDDYCRAVSRDCRLTMTDHGVSRCSTCDETFSTDAAETRHVDANPGHCRYPSDFELEVSDDDPST